MRIEHIRVDESFAAKLPEPPEREFEALKEDIERRGRVVVPLLVTADGLLLDGHRRLRAAKELGLKEVPAQQLSLEGESWEAAVALASNLHRRHLNEASRAMLADSLLRLERAKARERMAEGGRAGRPGVSRQVERVGTGVPRFREKDRATERVARQIGICRKTLERVQKIKDADPELAEKARAGKISVARAYRKVQVREMEERFGGEPEPGTSDDSVRLAELEDGCRRYRTLYMNPPWERLDLTEFANLSIPELTHPGGAHVWCWASFRTIREGKPQDLFGRWELHWASEICWNRVHTAGSRWVRPQVEVLILAVTKGCFGLLRKDQGSYFEEALAAGGSTRPEGMYEVIERLSPGPRIELFAKKSRAGWDRWEYEK